MLVLVASNLSGASRLIPITAVVSVTEAAAGVSDSNWSVKNVVDGAWAAQPYFPDMQWMARQIGVEDVWCDIVLDRPYTINLIELQSSKLGASFDHVKDIMLEFPGNRTVPISLACDDTRQMIYVAPTTTDRMRIHLLSTYGDGGAGINVNSAGFAEVGLYEVVEYITRPGHYDLNQDGSFDLLVFTWQTHLTCFIADDGRLPWTGDWERDWDAYFDEVYSVGVIPRQTWNPRRGDFGSYTLLSDRNDNGLFDDMIDYWYQAVDIDGDGDPDIERTDRYCGTTGLDGSGDEWGELFKYNFDLDDDNRMNNIDWSVPGYGDEQGSYSYGNYISDRAGNGFFLQAWDILHGQVNTMPEAAWENPIAWYDLDGDGCTEMVVRVTDTHGDCKGTLMEAEIALDLDRSSNSAQESSLDIQLSWIGHQSRPYIYKHLVEDFPAFRGLPEADLLFGRRVNLRRGIRRMYIPFFDAYKRVTELDECAWDNAFLLVDEDNDDNRWEEMFSPHEKTGYEDRLGDRWECDDDYDGGGKLYIGRFDGRLHLYQADRAEWSVDYGGLYRGAQDRPLEPPSPPPGLMVTVVRYEDRNDNGFIDLITWGQAEWGNPDSFAVVKIVNLLDFATAANPEPDVCEAFDIRTRDALTRRKISAWDGKDTGTFRLEAYDRLTSLFELGVAEPIWQRANALYRLAAAKGLVHGKALDNRPQPAADIRVEPGYQELLKAETLWQKYSQGYLLGEKVIEDILKALPADRKIEIERLFYTGDWDGLHDLLGKL